MPPTVSPGRDLRLDLFRGLALWLIFLDHIPSNIVNWITIRNYGFSDAAEIFVFISGYTAAFVYGRAMRSAASSSRARASSSAPGRSTSRTCSSSSSSWREIAYVTTSLDNPALLGRNARLRFPAAAGRHAGPGAAAQVQAELHGRAAALHRAAARVSAVLWLLLRWPIVALLLSVALYAAVQHFYWNLPAYPTGTWFFNPFAWQLIFVVGAWCGVGGAERIGPLLRSRYVVGVGDRLSGARVVGRDDLVLPALCGADPEAGAGPGSIRSTRSTWICCALLHFCALAIVTVRFIPIDWPGLKSRWLRPAILCGQHSLEIFCLGMFLSFIGHFVTSEISGRIVMQISISALGILIMIAVASLITWYKTVEGRGSGGRPKPPAGRPRRRRGMRRIAGALIGVLCVCERGVAGPGDACAVAGIWCTPTAACRASPLPSKPRI